MPALQLAGTVTVLPGKPDVKEKSWEGRNYTSQRVACFAEMADGTAAAFTVTVPEGSPIPAPGQYALAPESLFVKDGKLALSLRFGNPVGGGAKQ